jgi:hypothetical protein
MCSPNGPCLRLCFCGTRRMSQERWFKLFELRYTKLQRGPAPILQIGVTSILYYDLRWSERPAFGVHDENHNLITTWWKHVAPHPLSRIRIRKLRWYRENFSVNFSKCIQVKSLTCVPLGGTTNRTSSYTQFDINANTLEIRAVKCPKCLMCSWRYKWLLL